MHARTATAEAVNTEVWVTAKELAGGDPARIQIMSFGEVIVWNHPATQNPRPGRGTRTGGKGAKAARKG